MSEEKWDVVRTDEHGREFLVMDGLDQAMAKALLDTLAVRGHKQFYEIRPHTQKPEPN